MTKKEFASQIRVRDSQFNRGLFIGFTVAGLWMFIAPLLDHFYDLNKSKFLLQAWYGLGCIIILAVLATLIVFGSRRGIPCPHCGKRLFGVPGQIVVATGVCGYCGERVFD